MRSAASRTLVIAIGNEFRCDDSAGLIAARRLRELRSDLTIIENRGDCAALLDLWDGADTVILLDAVQSGAPPGSIHRFGAAQNFTPSAALHTCSHNFEVVQAIDLARALGRLPRRVIVYGIEGERFDEGTELSAPVQRAVEQLTAELAGAEALSPLLYGIEPGRARGIS
jgi:hydrogenase maturation protease